MLHKRSSDELHRPWAVLHKRSSDELHRPWAVSYIVKETIENC